MTLFPRLFPVTLFPPTPEVGHPATGHMPQVDGVVKVNSVTIVMWMSPGGNDGLHVCMTSCGFETQSFLPSHVLKPLSYSAELIGSDRTKNMKLTSIDQSDND